MTDTASILLDGAALARALARIAHEIAERNHGLDDVVFVGIRSRGYQIATRVAERLRALTKREVPVGSIDITPYRDDVEQPRERIEVTATDVPFPIDGRVVVIVDDVVATGRTVRVALDVLSGLGRPRAVQVAVLIDRRDVREVPVHAHYVGQNMAGSDPRRVHVRVRELDGTDEVALQ